MAKVDLSYLKTRFESGDRPSQQDFTDLIDTLAAKSTDLGSNGNNESVVSGIENITTLESIPVADWRLVKYMVSLSKTTGGDNKFYATEFTILIDGTNINVSQYGIIDNDGDIGTVDVSRVGSNLELKIIPNPAVKPVTARFGRVGLKA
jgi:hypothetical protein